MSKKYCKHLNEWREEGKWYLCSDCGMEMSPDLDHNSAIKHWQERAEKAEARVVELEHENRRLKILSGVFRGRVEGDVKDKLIKFWMELENWDMPTVFQRYWCRDTELLCNKLSEPCWFVPDDKETCFELEDGNWVIPRNIIVEVDDE